MSKSSRTENLLRLRELKSSLLSASLNTDYSEMNRAYLDLRATHSSQCLIPEILVEVFQWAALDVHARDQECDISRVSLRTNVPPINFSQVCREWRLIALGLPGLWSSVRINPQNHQEIRCASSRIGSWLIRSSISHVPPRLKFSVNLPTMTNPDIGKRHVEDAYSLLQQMFIHSPRWRDTHVSYDPTLSLQKHRSPYRTYHTSKL